jgi:hypothetical protein
MRVKHLAQKNKMGKGITANSATSWVPSDFQQKDLDKARADGLVSDADQVTFPSTERIPKLHQLTPNSILHIACFITLCESFLGIKPHFLLWKYLFRLCPSVALTKKPKLGSAVVSIRAESQYLEFSMAAIVQGWRKKWFYIKDQKVSSSDQYDIAPFDASKEVKKLASWDSPPTEAEMEEIKPLLARIQELQSGRGGAFSGTQLMAFFLQHRVQPLQHRLSKLWTFSGLGDSSRVSEDLMEKKDLDK